MTFSIKTPVRILLLTAISICVNVHAVEWSGLFDLRAVSSDTDRSWTRDGVGKLRYDQSNGGMRIGQAMLRGEAELTDTTKGVVILKASDDRHSIFDVTEAWIRWSPVPGGPWKIRTKVGVFFPAMSLENDGLGWTPTRMISSSAINSWIGEEIRTRGVELNVSRRGHFEGSPHDVGFTAALFNGNDPAGTLIAWRGWGIGDRITGLTEPIQLADLPVYRPSGAIWRQSRSIHLFRELDGRAGFYLGANYGYEGWLNVAAMHYDNRANPLVVKDGQYGWDTRFNHLSLRVRPDDDWEILLQGLDGVTLMGPRAVHVDYRSWYALIGHSLGPGRLALRYDKFMTQGHDRLPSDPNDEDGRGLALAYTYDVSESWRLMAEMLCVHSTRSSRLLIGEAARQKERSFTFVSRWQF